MFFLYFYLSRKNICATVALPILLFIMYLANRVHTGFSIKNARNYVRMGFFFCLLLSFETEMRLRLWCWNFTFFLLAGILLAGEIHIWA
jgi:hypothetical protein